MGALFSVLRLVALLATAYVLLKVLRNYVTRSPLDNIPGPSSAHWMKGMKHVYYLPPYFANDTSQGIWGSYSIVQNGTSPTALASSMGQLSNCMACSGYEASLCEAFSAHRMCRQGNCSSLILPLSRVSS